MATRDFTAAALAALEQKRLEYTAHLLAENTQKNYRQAWAKFTQWTTGMGLTTLPAAPETIALFVVALLEIEGNKVTTARHRVAAIRHMHIAAGFSDPVTPAVTAVLGGARRSRQEQVRQMLPLTVEELRQICLLLVADGTLVSVRNRALILTGFTAALRNSETAALCWEDLEFVPEGVLLRIRKSKVDQISQGAWKGLLHGKHPETNVVGALLEWKARCGKDRGPVFIRFARGSVLEPLGPERIGQLIQRLATRIGLAPEGHAGHTLRRGVVTALGMAGVTTLLIGAHTGQSGQTVERYFDKRRAFEQNPLSRLDL